MHPCGFLPYVFRLSVINKIEGIFKTTLSSTVPPIFQMNPKKERRPEDCNRCFSPPDTDVTTGIVLSESCLGQHTCSYFLDQPRQLLLLFSSGESVQCNMRAFLPAGICLGESRRAIGLSCNIHLETVHFS